MTILSPKFDFSYVLDPVGQFIYKLAVIQTDASLPSLQTDINLPSSRVPPISYQLSIIREQGAGSRGVEGQRSKNYQSSTTNYQLSTTNYHVSFVCFHSSNW
ncbi:hypothetical protein H6G17_03460 [Chroococcidiopsis sp. FACHB-1243]|uniref:hypothetical protein n=1 Tax=Chroococcidiopsis sp. [FACHB-1243] TaxID=2692781 RepID=UPI0017815F39|nr:hypothetical protein [Chroococcidiopsis sp. [FACHB-1243]]MBD2304576.1 hypothetical protein [Chroococcidiopsis sp. [FACHB-1243]]